MLGLRVRTSPSFCFHYSLSQQCLVALNNIQQGKRMKKSDIQQWFKRVDRLRVLATSFYDTAALEELDRQIERMNWAHKVLTGTHSPVVNKGISR